MSNSRPLQSLLEKKKKEKKIHWQILCKAAGVSIGETFPIHTLVPNQTLHCGEGMRRHGRMAGGEWRDFDGVDDCRKSSCCQMELGLSASQNSQEWLLTADVSVR